MEVTESISQELRSLIGFAARLGTTVCCADNAPSLVSISSNEIGEEAQLLMNFCNSGSSHHEPKRDDSHNAKANGVTAAAETTDDKLNHEFSFTCPSLSLNHADPTESAPPALLGRKLTVKSKDGLRLNSEAMALNLLKSFQQALEWRRGAWISTLEHSLAGREFASVTRDWKELLGSPEAKVLKTLQEMPALQVVEARTSFKVSKRRWQISEVPKQKKARFPTRTAGHVLSFQCVLALITPAGYSQVTLEAPGVIEGIWESEKGDLKRVDLQLDTRVLSEIMEQSCRFLVRASVEHFWEHDDMDDPLSDDSEDVPSAAAVSSDTDESLVYTTPRQASSPDITVSNKTCIPLPSQFEEEARLVSPQPRGSFSPPLMPRKTYGKLPLVSPPPRNDGYLSTEEAGPSLPALVEVACAAMKS